MTEADVASILEGIEALKFQLGWIMIVMTMWMITLFIHTGKVRDAMRRKK